jgi:hypothetical protein
MSGGGRRRRGARPRAIEGYFPLTAQTERSDPSRPTPPAAIWARIHAFLAPDTSDPAQVLWACMWGMTHHVTWFLRALSKEVEQCLPRPRLAPHYEAAEVRRGGRWIRVLYWNRPPTRGEEMAMLDAALRWLRGWAARHGLALFDELFPRHHSWLPAEHAGVTLRRPALVEGIAYLAASAHLLVRAGMAVGALRPRGYPKCFPFAAAVPLVVEGMGYYNITASLTQACNSGPCCKGWRPKARLLQDHQAARISICCGKANTCLLVAEEHGLPREEALARVRVTLAHPPRGVLPWMDEVPWPPFREQPDARSEGSEDT